jgi:DNA-binding response OmpR family regulator
LTVRGNFVKNMIVKILIIDDEQYIDELVRDWLEIRGFEVGVAYNGAEGKKAILETRPDVVFLDAILPDVKGVDLLNQLKTDPDTKNIKIIMISADDSIKGALALGADDVIVKPLSINILLAKLKAVNT